MKIIPSRNKREGKFIVNLFGRPMSRRDYAWEIRSRKRVAEYDLARLRYNSMKHIEFHTEATLDELERCVKIITGRNSATIDRTQYTMAQESILTDGSV